MRKRRKGMCGLVRPGPVVGVGLTLGLSVLGLWLLWHLTSAQRAAQAGRPGRTEVPPAVQERIDPAEQRLLKDVLKERAVREPG